MLAEWSSLLESAVVQGAIERDALQARRALLRRISVNWLRVWGMIIVGLNRTLQSPRIHVFRFSTANIIS